MIQMKVNLHLFDYYQAWLFSICFIFSIFFFVNIHIINLLPKHSQVQLQKRTEGSLQDI